MSLWTDATKVLGKPFVAFHLGLIPGDNFKDHYKTVNHCSLGAYLVSETHQSLQFLSKRFSTKLDQLCKRLVLEGRNFTFHLCYHKGDFNRLAKNPSGHSCRTFRPGFLWTVRFYLNPKRVWHGIPGNSFPTVPNIPDFLASLIQSESFSTTMLLEITNAFIAPSNLTQLATIYCLPSKRTRKDVAIHTNTPSVK